MAIYMGLILCFLPLFEISIYYFPRCESAYTACSIVLLPPQNCAIPGDSSIQPSANTEIPYSTGIRKGVGEWWECWKWMAKRHITNRKSNSARESYRRGVKIYIRN